MTTRGRQHDLLFRLIGGHLAVILLTCLPVLTCNTHSPASIMQDPPPDVTSDVPQDQDDDRHERQLALSRQVLMNPSDDIDASLRLTAAQELLLIDHPDAGAALSEALRSVHAATVSAVIQALRERTTVRSDLVEPIVDALLTAADTQRDALVLELARHGNAAVLHLAAVIDDDSRPATARLNAAYGLGAVRTRESAAALVGVLDSERAEPAELTSQACSSLTRLTGFTHGDDPARWRDWWRSAQDLTDDEWSHTLLNALSDRILTLEGQMQVEREANRQVVARLIETYRELFASISREDEQKRLEPLLSDSLGGVRLFALSRIERMLRDGVRIDELLQQRVPPLLNDADPDIRRRSALVLEQLAHPALISSIAGALANERNGEVAAEYLGILANHPSPDMLEPVLARMSDPAHTDLVARAVWKLLNGPATLRQQVAGEHREAIRGAVESLPEGQRTPLVLRVQAAVCAPETMVTLTPHLDSQDEQTKRAVAEGIALRGRDAAQPLLDRSSDRVIYPFAIRALADGPATLEVLRRITDLHPAEADNQDWPAALIRVTSGLPANSILAADDLLAGMEHVSAKVRSDALAAALNQLPPDAAVDLRVALTMRLCTLLLGLDEHDRAHALLEALNGVPANPDLQQLRFRAALLAQRFDRAAELDAAPTSWIALVTTLTNSSTETSANLARRISEEIHRRFDGQLSDEQRANLDQAISMLPSRDGGGRPGGLDESESENATASASGTGL